MIDLKKVVKIYDRIMDKLTDNMIAFVGCCFTNMTACLRVLVDIKGVEEGKLSKNDLGENFCEIWIWAIIICIGFVFINWIAKRGNNHENI